MTEAKWLTSDDPGWMLLSLQRVQALPPGAAGNHPRDWRLSARKLRLFACACVRQVWHLLTDPRSRRAVEVAERYADGLATVAELAQARNAAFAADAAAYDDAAYDDADAFATAAFAAADAFATAAFVASASAEAAGGVARKAQANLLRDIAGNPWRPVTLRNGPCAHCKGYGCRHCVPWLTPTVLSLARAAYEERPGRECANCATVRESVYGRRLRLTVIPNCTHCGGTGHIEDGTLDPHRLAILADALEEAGCPPEVLTPVDLRSTGETVCVAAPHPVLAHLRSSGPHVRGCHVVDLLGRE